MRLTRRRALKVLATTTVVAATASSISHAAPSRVRISRHRLRWDVPRPLRLVHLTDLHVGPPTAPHLLVQAATATAAAQPDLVVMTGDFVNRTLLHLPDLRRLLAALPRPCVATLGNHDHWSGVRAVTAALQAEGVLVLRNSHVTLRHLGFDLPVVGVDDGWTGHDDVARAFGRLRRAESALVLTHFPTTADRIAHHGGRLVLAGHTHGGQVCVPLVTVAAARAIGNRYLAGWYRIGPTALYVNAGIGSAKFGLRMGRRAVPEVAVLEVAPAR